MAQAFDFIVVGGGIAGASVAYELSQKGRVALLEQESQPGYHSTARSAAVTSENYGPRQWQILCTASRAFFATPPEDFAEYPLLSPRGALYLAAPEEEPALRDAAAELARRRVRNRLMPAAEALSLCPVLKLEGFSLALLEPDCADIDTSALLAGYLRLARRNAAEVLTGVPASRIARSGGRWHVECRERAIEASVLVNAAGAWADQVAALAGLPRRGLTPYRRTAITFDPPAGLDISAWPMTFDSTETWYFKPEGGHLFASPVDKTASEPCDCQPEEIDIATAVWRIEEATTLTVPRLASRWAGLRTFAPDEQPVIGPDPEEPSFLWLAGQGGNGVMAAPAAARLAAALAVGDPIPSDIAGLGLEAEAVLPDRLLPKQAA